jgi:hypothetical protein
VANENHCIIERKRILKSVSTIEAFPASSSSQSNEQLFVVVIKSSGALHDEHSIIHRKNGRFKESLTVVEHIHFWTLAHYM